MTIGKTIQTTRLTFWLAVVILCGSICGCNSGGNTASLAKIKFRPYLLVDQRLDGMPVDRIMIPEDWKANSRLVWNTSHIYVPIQSHIRAEAPDGGSWVDFYGPTMFSWFDRAHESGRWGVTDWTGAIHHPNVSIVEAMVRYVIVPNRRKAKNMRILGYRQVDNLPKIFSRAAVKMKEGKGICLFVHYELDGAQMEEEFYGYMPTTDAIPYPPNGSTEFHSYLFLVHSLGAKAGKLESVRPLLGFITTSLELNPAWQKRVEQIHKAGLDQAQRNIDQTYANIELAKQISAQAHASNEAFLRRSEANRAQNRAQDDARRSSNNAPSTGESDNGTDGFTQYMRGIEHMEDQNGVVSDQYSDYNYHWTDGNGSFVHSNDQTLDPNNYLNVGYQQMKPVR